MLLASIPEAWRWARGCWSGWRRGAGLGEEEEDERAGQGFRRLTLSHCLAGFVSRPGAGTIVVMASRVPGASFPLSYIVFSITEGRAESSYPLQYFTRLIAPTPATHESQLPSQGGVR